jgi:hypothetical protein
MSRRFSPKRPTIGAGLPHNVFGHLVGQFQFSSHIPLRGGKNTGRHIFLSIKVPTGPFAGIYECAVNIRSDEDTNVTYAQRIEDLDSGSVPALGFEQGVHLAYGNGGDASDASFMGLSDGDFTEIVHDDLYNRIDDLSQNCDRVGAYGLTYSGGDGINDIQMNSCKNPSDPHARQDRDRQDGAVAFYFDMAAGGQSKAFWVFVKFESQNVVNS